ncbi:hypothetical protein CUU64_07825 [Bacillus sp. V5-8f]|nr:hypothetical protein CUU64_07825 [Bacillus sp. V5-8f]
MIVIATAMKTGITVMIGVAMNLMSAIMDTEIDTVMNPKTVIMIWKTVMMNSGEEMKKKTGAGKKRKLDEDVKKRIVAGKKINLDEDVIDLAEGKKIIGTLVILISGADLEHLETHKKMNETEESGVVHSDGFNHPLFKNQFTKAERISPVHNEPDYHIF